MTAAHDPEVADWMGLDVAVEGILLATAAGELATVPDVGFTATRLARRVRGLPKME